MSDVEPEPIPTLRLITVHSLSGGVGCSTVAMLLADHFSEDRAALVVEANVSGSSLVDGLQLVAPKGEADDGSVAYHDLQATRDLLDKDSSALPDLMDAFERDDLRPEKMAWSLAAGNAGSGRVFVLPGCVSPVNLYEEDDAQDAIVHLIREIACSCDQDGSFGVVIVDMGRAEFNWSALTRIDSDTPILHTQVTVLSPHRANLRTANRMVGFDDELKRMTFVLNQCDSDLGVLLAGVRRANSGDLQGTLFTGDLSPLGQALHERGVCLPTNPQMRWAHGGPFRSDGFHQIYNLAEIIEKHAWDSKG